MPSGGKQVIIVTNLYCDDTELSWCIILLIVMFVSSVWVHQIPKQTHSVTLCHVPRKRNFIHTLSDVEEDNNSLFSSVLFFQIIERPRK